MTPPQPPQAAGPRVSVAATGKDAELIKTLQIASSGSVPKVVLRLPQGGDAHASLPDLHPGDRLLVSAELEVTTDCVEQQSDCVGKPYAYAPKVEATLLLAKSGSVAVPEPGRGVRVGRTLRRKCTHKRHHDVLVFDNVPYVVPQAGLQWSGPTSINLALRAANPAANRGHVLVIGQHNPGGVVAGDMGGISVVRLRPGSQTMPPPLRTDQRRATTLPVVKGQRAVVYSQPLDGLARGEQLAVRAMVNVSTAHLAYPARVTTEILIAGGPDDYNPGSEAKRVTPDGPQVCRGNGFNCLAAESPASSRKAGAIRIAKDAKAPLYVNVVLVTGDPLRKAQPGHSLNILEGGYLEVVRYPAERAG